MADEVHSEARLRVQVEGQQEVDRLAASFAALQKTGATVSSTLKPAAVNAAGATQMKATAENIKKGGEKAAKEVETASVKNIEKLFHGIGRAVSEPFYATAKIARVGIRQFAGAIDPLFGRLSRLGPQTLALGGIGLAVTGLLKPLIALWAGIKTLGISFEWAQEKARDEIKAAAETRRRYPGLVGEAFDRAQDQVHSRINLMTAMFGEGAVEMGHAIERRMRDVAAGKGSDRDREIMERWGLTLRGKEAMESRTGPADIVTYLERFVSAREKMETEIKGNPTGANADRLRRNINRLIRDAFDFSGGRQDFVEMVAGWRKADIAKLKQQMDEVKPLGKVDKAATQNAIDFEISLRSLRGAFDAIKRGIVADTLPGITGFLDSLRKRLTETGAGGQSLGKQLRDLGRVMIDKSWQTLQDLLSRIDLKAVNEWIRVIAEEFHPREAADAIIKFGKSIWTLTGYLLKAVDMITSIFEHPIAKFLLSMAGQSMSPGTPSNPKYGRSLQQLQGAAGVPVSPQGGGASVPSIGGAGLTGGLPGGGAVGPQSTTASGGHAASQSDMVAYIRQAAIARGIDPDVAVGVARSEGLNKYSGDRGTSFGPFQLHYKNNIPGLSMGGLGDVFTRKTGLDARDPSTWRQQVEFALDEAAKGGWGPWHGWRGGSRAGLGGAKPKGVSTPDMPSPSIVPNSLLSPENLAKPFVKSDAFDAAIQGKQFGAAAANQFRAEVGTVGIGTGNVSATSAGVTPRIEPPPTGGDTPT